MACCPRCIGDSYLRKTVSAIRSREVGRCAYCGSDNEQLLEPAALRDHFELVIGIYVQNDSGHSIVECLKEDWGFFDHPQMDVAHAKELLGDIMDDGNLVRRHFVPEDPGGSASLQQWEAFREELMHRNRYFPKGAPNLDRMKDLVSCLTLETGELPGRFVRARILQRQTLL